MKRLSTILNAAQTLDQKQLEMLSSKILQMLQLSSELSAQSSAEAKTVYCRRCSSDAVLKYGKDKNGKQRYKCKSCGTIFYETSYSVISKTRHSLATWKKYINLLMEGASLVECATKCNISVQTAFTWRHKILHALQSDQCNRVMGGVVEIDDMFFSVSYKGNHTKSKSFSMPRKAYERGTDNTAATGGKACVLCAVERQGQTYAEVIGVGKASVDKLRYAFHSRLLDDTIALTDKAYDYKNYFSTTSIDLVQLAAHSHPRDPKSAPEVKGSYHIQNVNNLHSRIRRAMKGYNGVATKYLNHYINLFVWIENHKKTNEYHLDNEMIATLYNSSSYISFNEITSLPVIPSVA